VAARAGTSMSQRTAVPPLAEIFRYGPKGEIDFHLKMRRCVLKQKKHFTTICLS